VGAWRCCPTARCPPRAGRVSAGFAGSGRFRSSGSPRGKRVRFASGEGPRAAAELKSALATITSGDFAGAEDAATVTDDVLAGANIFAYYGDLASAARAQLADEITPRCSPHRFRVVKG
jgi:hypothetical protein